MAWLLEVQAVLEAIIRPVSPKKTPMFTAAVWLMAWM